MEKVKYWLPPSWFFGIFPNESQSIGKGTLREVASRKKLLNRQMKESDCAGPLFYQEPRPLLGEHQYGSSALFQPVLVSRALTLHQKICRMRNRRDFGDSVDRGPLK